MSAWEEIEVEFSEIEKFLQDGYQVDISSPDGFVPVTEYIHKGDFEKWILESNGKIVECNEDHRFETQRGWVESKNITFFDCVLHDDGNFYPCSIKNTHEVVEIVDLQVAHENQRYYANGISSHNTGKSTFMTHHAAHCLSMGLNVLYITLEMAEERIAERIDANLMDITLQDMRKMTKEQYLNGMGKVRNKMKSKLVIKEYPTSGAHAGHFDALIEELKIKKKFKPDVLIVDYLNICNSQRYKPGGSNNSYIIVKGIAEELRGLAVKHNLCALTCTQFNRGSIGNSNPDLSNVSESTGLSATLDFFFALISTEELEKDQQIMIKQLKNRFGDLNYYGKFLVGLNRAKMKFYDLDDSAAMDGITQDKSTDDSGDFSFSKFKGNYDGIGD